jgi:raffinose/stachyose/melibiose transport system substrate-binding protein
MKRSSRRSMAVSAVAAHALSVTPSSGGGGGTGGGDDGDALTFLSWSGEEVMGPVVEAFEAEHPDIPVEISYAPPVAEYIQALQTRVLSGTAPDVFVIAAENKTNLIDGGHVVDLSGEPWMSTIPEFNKDTYSKDGKVYGASTSTWGAGIGYNKELLAEVGADTVPATWDEFLDLCRKLQDAGIKPFLEDLTQMPTMVSSFVGAHNAEQGFTMDEKIFDGTSSFEEEWTDALTQYNELYEEGLGDANAVGLTDDQVFDEFANGRVAMITSGPWNVTPLKEAAPDMDFAIAPIPAADGGSPFLAGAASPGYAVNAKSDKIEDAKTFIEYLVSAEGVQHFQELSNDITVTTDYEPKLDPALETIVEDVRAGNVYLPMIAWTRSEDVLNVEAVAQIQQMVQGKVTPQEAAAALDQKLASS